MLASTVQFSNNDQPPTTPPSQASSLGPAPKERATLAPSDTQQRARPVPARRSCVPRPLTRAVLASLRPVNRPNNQRSTHEQPPQNIRLRNGPGPPGKPGGLDAP